MTRESALRIALVLVGTVCLALGPLMLVWPAGWRWSPHHAPYEQMMVGIYFTLGIFLLRASRDPARHASIVWFAVWSSIVHAGVFDLTVQFASDSHWDRPSAYGNAPWTDPVELDRWSPSRFSPKFATPTLITHGEKDYRVPVTQGINLHGVLTGKGVPSRIVIFPDENHWILKPQASKLWYDEVGAWLDRWVEPRGKAR